MKDIYDSAIMKGAARRIGQKAREAKLADTSNTSEDEYGSEVNYKRGKCMYIKYTITCD